MILVPLFDLKFLNEFAAGGVGTSNRRHECETGVTVALAKSAMVLQMLRRPLADPTQPCYSLFVISL